MLKRCTPVRYHWSLFAPHVLCFARSLVCSRESFHVLLNAALVSQELHICTIDQDATFLLQPDVFVSSQRCEAPVLADNDLLATREFVHRSSKCFDGSSTVGVSSSNGEEDLANVYASYCAIRLAPCTTHPRLQSIGTCAGQHLVDSDNVIWVSSYSEVESFLASNFDEISSLVSYVDLFWTTKTHLLAQIRAASSASELSCSYSLDTMWTQRGNSSTLARLRPRSKIRILGSGTPRLNLDFGSVSLSVGFQARGEEVGKSMSG